MFDRQLNFIDESWVIYREKIARRAKSSRGDFVICFNFYASIPTVARYLSASKAAMHPEPAAVTACL